MSLYEPERLTLLLLWTLADTTSNFLPSRRPVFKDRLDFNVLLNNNRKKVFERQHSVSRIWQFFIVSTFDESDGICVLGGSFFLQTNFDIPTTHF